MDVRGVVAAWLLLCGVVAGTLTSAPPVAASPQEFAASSTFDDVSSLAELLPDPTGIIHPDIVRQVDVDLSGLSGVAARLSAAREAEEAATIEGQQLRAERSHLVVVERETRAELGLAVVEVNAATGALERSTGDLGSFALETFVGSSALELESFSTDTDPSSIPTLSASAEFVLISIQRAATLRLESAVADRERVEGELADVEAEMDRLSSGIEAADIARDAAAIEVAEIAPEFEAALWSAPVVGAGFPVVVLDAYYRAALRTAEEKPWCEVRWDQLAGIGKVESGHGTFGGNRVGADGRTDGEILGPVLDGTRFASIPDTDGGRFDLDPVWDRAVGPMQFIPGSWVRFGADGNADGQVDPHNMYDAAMAAANHLCGSTGGLGEDANYQRALLGYNRSVPYGLMVMDFARQYRDAVALRPTSTSVADPVR